VVNPTGWTSQTKAEAALMMISNYRDSLPKMGALCVQWVRCGRPSCACGSGRQLHGPYHYLFFRAGRRLQKRYVRKADVAAVRDVIEAERVRRHRHLADQQASKDTWRIAVERLREVEEYVRTRSEADSGPESRARG